MDQSNTSGGQSVPKCSLAFMNTLMIKLAILRETPAPKLWFKSKGSSIDRYFDVQLCVKYDDDDGCYKYTVYRNRIVA